MVITPKKAKRNRFASLIVALIFVFLLILLSSVRASSTFLLWTVYFPIIILIGLVIYRFLTRKFRRRLRILSKPFNKSWRQILESKIAFYNGLSVVDKEKFEAEVAIFLAEKRITGIKTELDETTKILVAASAVIPIFGFSEWEYDNLAEVLVYPSSFDSEMQFENSTEKNILGMVGSSGALNRMMILSKTDLHRSFEILNDGHNVGIHEFAHLIDGADGSIDGVPAVACPDCVKPWLELVRKEMGKLATGNSILNSYGLTNPSEFFAVASEVFFSTPEHLSKHHPELYQMLERIFHQDTRSVISDTVRSMFMPYRRKIGRNAKCPCGKNKKFKQCCLNQPKL